MLTRRVLLAAALLAALPAVATPMPAQVALEGPVTLQRMRLAYWQVMRLAEANEVELPPYIVMVYETQHVASVRALPGFTGVEEWADNEFADWLRATFPRAIGVCERVVFVPETVGVSA